MQLTVRGQPVRDPAAFRRELLAAVRGRVAFDPVTRGVYATDASAYQVTPGAVVEPMDRADVVAAVEVAARHGVAVTARGGGTSLSGQTTWTGVVLDLSRHMDRVLSVDAEAGTARVEPGVVRDRLNARLAGDPATAHLHFAPDPATGSRACVGGMIGNNSSGTRSIVHGMTSDHVLALTVLLSDGSVVELDHADADEWPRRAAGGTREAALYRGVQALVERRRAEIAARFPKTMRRVSGYAVDALLDCPERGGSLVPLIVGSEGTLGVVLGATVRLVPRPAATAMCVAHFETCDAALRAVPGIVAHGPSAVELLDDVVCFEAARNPTTRELADFVELQGDGDPPGGLLICEVFGDDPADAARKAHAVADDVTGAVGCYACPVRTDAAGQARVWEVRKLGLGLISNVPGPVKGQAFIEDACVPIAHLADYIAQVRAICDEESLPFSVYAHASVGVLHCRPMLDLHQPEHAAAMQRVADRCFELVVGYGGSWSSEHGDGLVRGRYIRRFFGDELADAFGDVKRLFDPLGVMNPGKATDTPTPIPAMTEHLRYDPARYRIDESPLKTTAFRHADQGGLLPAVEQCNGVGACRKIDAGTMCPSYMATRDETHSTRGRANVLRLALTGQLDGMTRGDALASDGLHDALSLCLSCKACKTECPNAVDMSRLKADALQARHARRGVPMRSRLIAGLPVFAKWTPRFVRRITNPVLRSKVARGVQGALGLARDRTLPPLAIDRWPIGRQQSGISNPAVILFADTWSREFEPRVGGAAEALLRSLGFSVTVATPGCCQRPAISQGMLDHAKRHGLATLAALDATGDVETPILCIEPSCASALRDDLPDLIEDEALGARVAGRVRMLDAYLAEAYEAGTLDAPLRSDATHALLHGHCHHKALFGDSPVAALLRRAGVDVQHLDAGCCGMAGAFGYEHADVSRAVFEDRLGPAVRSASAETVVCTTGISCRHQLAEWGVPGQRVASWVELLKV